MPVTDQNSDNKSDDEKRHSSLPVRTKNLSTLQERKTGEKFEFRDFLIFPMLSYLSAKDKIALLVVLFKSLRNKQAIQNSLDNDPDYHIKKLNWTIKTVIPRRAKENSEKLKNIEERINILITTEHSVSYMPCSCGCQEMCSKSYFDSNGLRLLTEQSFHRMNFETQMERLKNNLGSPELLASINDYPRRRALKYSINTGIGTSMVGLGGLCCIPNPMVVAWGSTFLCLGGVSCISLLSSICNRFSPQCGFDAASALDQVKVDYQTIRILSGIEEKADCLLKKGEWESAKFLEKEKWERTKELLSIKNEAKVSVTKLIRFFNATPFPLQRDNEGKPLHRKLLR